MHFQMFCKIDVISNLAKFAGKHLYGSPYLIKLPTLLKEKTKNSVTMETSGKKNKTDTEIKLNTTYLSISFCYSGITLLLFSVLRMIH